jgi:outer membrane protein assembly factor BamD
MKRRRLFATLLVLGCLALPQRSPAPVVIKKDEGVSYQAPGAEPPIADQRDAQAQFDAALAKEKAGSVGTAIAGYKKTVRRFPKSTIASTAQYKAGELMEKQNDLSGATKAYEKLLKDYPRSTDFNKALDGVFRIGTAWLEGARQKLIGVPTLPSMDKAVSTYGIIVQQAPYSRLAPLAQFNIGQAREKQGDPKAAIVSYQAVVDKYSTDPAAADALYQIGFCYMKISRSGSYDRIAAQRARESFEDFLAQYPGSEKAAQAKENLNSLANQQTGGSLQIARFYDKQGMYKAAIVYYNDVIKQQPNSPESEQAKTRLDALRAKLGDAAFNQSAVSATPTAPAGTAAANAAKKPTDGRLQAQTDTAKRPDYVGPPVSAPAPPPPPPASNVPGIDNLRPPSSGGSSSGGGSRPEPTPPPVPEGEQPTLPTQ